VKIKVIVLALVLVIGMAGLLMLPEMTNILCANSNWNTCRSLGLGGIMEGYQFDPTILLGLGGGLLAFIASLAVLWKV
jgi:hypothetical protein